MPFELPPLPYPSDSLEPHIDKATMEIHHGGHHKAYVDNLNKAVAGTPLDGKPLEALIGDLASVPDNIRGPVRNNAGGHWNHSFFWKLLSGKAPKAPEADNPCPRAAPPAGARWNASCLTTQTGRATGSPPCPARIL